jgi:hypothetical protein
MRIMAEKHWTPRLRKRKNSIPGIDYLYIKQKAS